MEASSVTQERFWTCVLIAILFMMSTTPECVVDILVSLEFYLCMDGSDQTAKWIDFKFADYVGLTPI
jgi:hypothetical protein